MTPSKRQLVLSLYAIGARTEHAVSAIVWL
jgi:hypothetical protein